MAPLMSSPSTNWRHISFMARATAVRITGSPSRLMAARRWRTGPGCASSSTRPVSISAHVEALTMVEVEWPRWWPQSEGAILSSISASIVSASGTRSSASARHINATPSSVDRPYSARKTSIRPGAVVLRIARTSPDAVSLIALRSCVSSEAVFMSAASTSLASAYVPVSMRARREEEGADAIRMLHEMVLASIFEAVRAC